MNLRTVQYFDGAVAFRVPEHWQESRDDDRTIVLFQTHPIAVTLRLTVLTSNLPLKLWEVPAIHHIRSAGDSADCEVLSLSQEHCLKTDFRTGGTTKRPTLLRFWHLGNKFPPHGWFQAVFSVTIDLKDKDLPPAVEIMQVMDAEIRNANLQPLRATGQA